MDAFQITITVILGLTIVVVFAACCTIADHGDRIKDEIDRRKTHCRGIEDRIMQLDHSVARAINELKEARGVADEASMCAQCENAKACEQDYLCAECRCALYS